VEVHAQLAAGLLDGRLPYTPAQAPLLQGLMALAAAGLLLMVTLRRGAAGGSLSSRRLPVLPASGALLALACAALGAAAPSQWGLWLPWAHAALFALAGGALLMVAEYAITRAQRERLSAHLGAYLPAPMAARLAAIDPSGHLEAERRQVSVLVADIRNFSAYAVHRPAEQTAAVLHAFSCVAVEVVERHGGVVESMVGDSIVAMWNAYGSAGQTPSAKHAGQALAAARELLKATQDLLAAAPSDGVESSVVQPLALGIGLECGDAIVGSFGPARRRTHAALGEPVTVAVRLQAMTQDLSVPILVGPRLAAAMPTAETVSLGEYLLEGLSRHNELFVPAAWAELIEPDRTLVPTAQRGRDAEDHGLPMAADSTTAFISARATGSL
jgi:adenylate cyclase